MGVYVVKIKPSILSHCSKIDLTKYISTVVLMELNIEDPQFSFLNISLKQRRPIIHRLCLFSLLLP